MGDYEEIGSTGPTAVAEVQGLFGPFQFPELLLQRIWAEQTFNVSGLRTVDGQAVKIEAKGRWNRLGGPDFADARIRVGEEWRRGAIEVHLREQDWRAHGHATDANYDGVILHVVLFPPKVAHTAGARKRRIPIVALLPLLWHDLEEYASDAAVSAIAARPLDILTERWLAMSAVEARAEIRALAGQRWRQKVHYAKLRIDKLGWESACHHMALEILGYKFNRSPMLQVATQWPLEAWRRGEVEVEAVFEAERPKWKLQGVRPANHPRTRLHSYARWVATGGEWPEILAEEGRAMGIIGLGGPLEVAEARRALGYTKQWTRMMAAIGATGAVASPRADNLWGDGLMPLLAAAGHLQKSTGFDWWFNARPGDQPDSLVKAARRIGFADGRSHPLAWGHVQGLMASQLKMEAAVFHRT
jgi:hypothetical protein